MAVNVLGRAYIEVHADTKPFGRELKAEVTAISTAVEKTARTSGRDVGKALGQGIERETTTNSPGLVRRIFSVFGREADKIGRGTNPISRFLFGSLRRDAEKAGVDAAAGFASSFTKNVGDTISAAAQGVGKLVSSIGSSVGNVGGSSPLSGIAGVGVILGIPALIGAVISLLNVLGPLINGIGLLPGAFALAGAAIVPVVVAFQGFGAAIQAIISGDPKKIAEAMKGLAPAAQSVAKDFQTMLPFLRELKKSTQQSFFARLVGDLPKVQAALGPIFTKGFSQVADAAGAFAHNLLQLAYDPVVQKFFADVFLFAKTAFDTLSDPVRHLVGALAEIADASFPHIQILIGMFGDLLDTFAKFLDESVRNGDFDEFLNNFMDALGAAKELGTVSIGLFKALLGGPDEEAKSRAFFALLIDVIGRLETFFKSDQGKLAIQGMIDLGRIFLVVLGGFVLLIGEALAEAEELMRVIKWVLVHTGIMGVGTDAAQAAANAAKGTTVSQSFGAAPGHAAGGIFDMEHLARIAEGGRREVVIPLTDRRRAMELADRSGLTQMMNNPPTVNVYIGDEQIQARVDKRVQLGIKGLTSSMTYGPRPIGVGG
jgi:hypothetical protein